MPFALYLLVAVQFVPETPRFLIGQGRDQEAFQFFVDYHGNGNPQDELVLFEFAEVKEAIRREKEAKAQKWSTILGTRPNRHRIGLAALMTFCTNVSRALLPALRSDGITDFPDVWFIIDLLLLSVDSRCEARLLC